MAREKRPDVKRILADPDLRRRLMVSTIQATQAREGIETTEEQADRAYYIVTEGEQAAFFDLESYRGGKGDPDRRHEAFVRTLRGELQSKRIDLARRDFQFVRGSPLAYKRLVHVGRIFRDYASLDPTFASVKSGLMTIEIERVVRYRWELPPARQVFLQDWTPFSKGGEYCRFFSDVELLIDCRPKTLEWLRVKGCLRHRDSYGQPGLTWVPRTQRGFNVRYLNKGAVFGKKGPIILPNRGISQWGLLAILNSHLSEYLIESLMSFGSYEVGVIQKLPIAAPSERLSDLSRETCAAKEFWDSGNELSTRFTKPWLLRGDIISLKGSVTQRLNQLGDFETAEDQLIQKMYAELNNEVYRLYGIPDSTRKVIKETLGKRPQEIIWPQMEGKTSEQKRMEHVWRLLSYAVKGLVDADEDGIVPFLSVANEVSLLDRIYKELEILFPDHLVSQVEVEIVNELKRKVRGYRSVKSIQEWLEDVFFHYHVSLYKNRPIIWHISSAQGRGSAAFGALVHYHKFDKNGMAKLRGAYLREAIEVFRREAALAAQDRREEDSLEWQAKLEEAQDLDRRLQLIQEGQHQGPEGGEQDFRILTPWKSSRERPKSWDPDLDDGVKVNIEPLQKAGVLRTVKVV